MEGATDWELRIFEILVPYQPAVFVDGEPLRDVTIDGTEITCVATVADGALHGFVDLRPLDRIRLTGETRGDRDSLTK